MNTELNKLIEVSRYYGQNKDYIIGSGGNTSYKNEKYLWVKASGVSLGDINEDGFALLYRDQLQKMRVANYPDDPVEREKEVKKDMIRSLVDPVDGKRPSVETLLHDSLDYKFVIHTHPTLVNAVMCSVAAEKNIRRLFGNEPLFVEYTDPGYVLSQVVYKRISEYKKKNKTHPQIIFLENHGVFVGADEISEIQEIYNNLEKIIRAEISDYIVEKDKNVDPIIANILPALRVMIKNEGIKTAGSRNSSIIEYYSKNISSFKKANIPGTPDMVVFCKSSWIFIDQENSIEKLISETQKKINDFRSKYGYYPKIIVYKNMGVVGLDENRTSLNIMLDVFEDLLKVSYLSGNFGGYKPLTPEQIKFIDEWEMEKFRKSLLKKEITGNVFQNKVAVVTGGAQGFGEGIVRSLFEQGASVVIADIQKEKGRKLSDEFNRTSGSAGALFVETDVSDIKSVEKMVYEAVSEFGGIDLLVSNAGVLKAGSLDEFDPESFDFITDVNYKGYFNCTKKVSEVMKLQNRYNSDAWFDIIQINSKSGLKGSKKNFVYAGSKFGGVGLTQSFALELAEYNIKVNAICPGNYFDGPLWSDPNDGLFVQYLEAGKVEGAETLEDVKRHYEKQVPMERGCTVKDVMVAIKYIVEQKYETGQAIAVTGGQVMLK